MPEETIEAEQEQMAADASFVTGSTASASTASASTTESTARSARATVLFRLVEGPMPPQDVGQDTSLATGQAHRALNTLRKRGLVELLVPPEASDGPIFGLTVRGEKTVFYLENRSSS